jgi:hypothetical protein
MADAPALGAGAPKGACRFDPDLAYQPIGCRVRPAARRFRAPRRFHAPRAGFTRRFRHLFPV